MKKIISILVMVALALTLFSSCSKKAAEIRLVTIKGPAGVAMVNLMSKNNTDKKYIIETVSSPEEVANKITSGEADIAACPTNMAAVLYKKTNGDVQMLATTMLGVLYVMENGNTIRSIEDLRGKTIYTTGQGANPEYVLRYILTENGINPDTDVTIEFRAQNDELAALLVSGTAQVALVPEPIVSTVKSKNSSLRVALDVTGLWDDVSDNEGQLIMSCAVARRDFAEKNPAAVKTFMDDLKASIEAAADVDATAALCAEFDIIPAAPIAKAALPGCNLLYMEGNEMKSKIEGYFSVLFTANPQSVGGALPEDAFYYKR